MKSRDAAEHRPTRHRNFVFDALRSVVHKIETALAMKLNNTSR